MYEFINKKETKTVIPVTHTRPLEFILFLYETKSIL